MPVTLDRSSRNTVGSARSACWNASTADLRDAEHQVAVALLGVDLRLVVGLGAEQVGPLLVLVVGERDGRRQPRRLQAEPLQLAVGRLLGPQPRRPAARPGRRAGPITLNASAGRPARFAGWRITHVGGGLVLRLLLDHPRFAAAGERQLRRLVRRERRQRRVQVIEPAAGQLGQQRFRHREVGLRRRPSRGGRRASPCPACRRSASTVGSFIFGLAGSFFFSSFFSAGFSSFFGSRPCPSARPSSPAAFAAPRRLLSRPSSRPSSAPRRCR